MHAVSLLVDCLRADLQDCKYYQAHVSKMMKRLMQVPEVDNLSVTSSTTRQPSATSHKEHKPTQQTTKPKLGQTGRGPSLLGLLAAKRLTKKLSSRYGRAGSLYGSSRYSASLAVHREPTYRLEPKRKFQADQVHDIIQEVIDERMRGFRYHPKFCSNLCKVLSDEIKDRIKRLRYDRYKIVALVHIGEKKDQCMQVSSRCAWDEKHDDFASYTLETPTLFCTASVFGIYTE